MNQRLRWILLGFLLVIVSGGTASWFIAKDRQTESNGSAKYGRPTFEIGRLELARHEMDTVLAERNSEMSKLPLGRKEAARRIEVIYDAANREMARVRSTNYKDEYNGEAVPHPADIPPAPVQSGARRGSG
jgi:hypothetical protein